MPARRSSRYGRYAGGPDPLAPPVDLSEALAQIGDDVMAGYSPERALREYLRRGAQGRDLIPVLEGTGRTQLVYAVLLTLGLLLA